MKINISTLNNKSRKGEYIAITKDGKRRIYKYDDKYPLDFYVELAKHNLKETQLKKGIKTNKKKVLSELERVTMGEESNYLKGMKIKYKKYKNKRLDEFFKTGRRSIKVELDKFMTNPRKYYIELLKPFVLDKELLNIVIANAGKFKNRFWYYTDVYGKIMEKGSKETQLSYHEDKWKTPMELGTQYLPKFKKGKMIHARRLQELVKEVNGFNYKPLWMDTTKGAKITKTFITIVFTKGQAQNAPQMNLTSQRF